MLEEGKISEAASIMLSVLEWFLIGCGIHLKKNPYCTAPVHYVSSVNPQSLFVYISARLTKER